MLKKIFVAVCVCSFSVAALALPTKADFKLAIESTDFEKIIEVKASDAQPAGAGLSSIDVIGLQGEESFYQMFYIYSSDSAPTVQKKFKPKKN